MEKLNRGFYGLNYFSRIIRIRSVGREIVNARLPEVDLLVYNNDGAFQRMVGARYKCSKIMLLDGVLSGNEHKAFFSGFKVKALKFLHYVCPLMYAHYLPSVLGVSGPNRSLVVTKHCQGYLEKNNVGADSIGVIGFPRLDIQRGISRRRNLKQVSQVVFVGQSFLWHGLNAFNSAMLAEIRFWKGLCDELGIEFFVKAHPRNMRGDFAEFEGTLTFSEDASHWDSGTVFVGMSSTFLLECHQLGYGVVVTRTSAFSKTIENMFYSSDFPVVENEYDAQRFLSDLSLCAIDNFDEMFAFGTELLFEEFEALLCP